MRLTLAQQLFGAAMLALFTAAPFMRSIPPCGSALAAAELKQRAAGAARLRAKVVVILWHLS
jgi:hypothetical protein